MKQTPVKRLLRTIVAVSVVLVLPCFALGQIIPIKTVPLAAGNQFMMFPSQNRAAGNIAIAIDDPLLDPFVNPAKGKDLRGHLWISSPTYYHISNDLGSGKTLPLAMLIGTPNYFGGVALSIQQVHSAKPERGGFLLQDQSRNNTYLFGLFGKRMKGHNSAVAASVFWADLHGMDGVELLYPGSDAVNQYGQLIDLRLAMVSESQRRSQLEALLIYQNFSMTHDVTRSRWFWLPEFSNSGRSQSGERNLDRTQLWGVHLGYRSPKGPNGVRLGGILTLNRKLHPKIPNYELMNIPRDPGDSWAFNIGVGVSREGPKDAVGFDLIYEPIFTTTWADAGTFMTAHDGRIIPPWGHTVDNRFRFANGRVRFGLIHHESDRLSLLGGIESRLIAYRLTQKNHIEGFTRSQRERWIEWTLTWGLAFGLAEGEIRYQGSVTSGTGRPGVQRFSWPDRSALAAENILIAPDGALTLESEKLFTHQIIVSLPFGGEGKAK